MLKESHIKTKLSRKKSTFCGEDLTALAVFIKHERIE
jgi:hypothetical protein